MKIDLPWLWNWPGTKNYALEVGKSKGCLTNLQKILEGNQKIDGKIIMFAKQVNVKHLHWNNKAKSVDFFASVLTLRVVTLSSRIAVVLIRRLDTRSEDRADYTLTAMVGS